MCSQQSLTESDLMTLLGQTLVRGLSFHEETDSTNTQALNLLSSQANLETPYLIYANLQTSGRGRGENRWWSSTGSLTFSLIVDCNRLGVSAEKQPLLSLLTAMALLQSGKSVIPRAKFALKWPNDVYLDSRKLAGILAEAPAGSTQRNPINAPRHVVIGVGLNVNNAFTNAPNEIQKKGISLSDVASQPLNRIEILASFLRNFEVLLHSLARGKNVLDAWPAICFLSGKQVTVETGQTEVTGYCRGIDASGALLLDTDQGQQRFVGGVVKSWSPANAP